MALSESQRIELYERIKRTSLGEEGAQVVMNAIPNIDWSDLATHGDLALLRSDLRAEMAELRGELRAEMAELRGELRTEMADLRGELRTEMADLRSEFAELRGEFSELRSEFHVELVGVENRLQRSIVTWILAAQGITLAVIGLLVTLLVYAIA